jgi:nucleoid DNA-binding protein
MTERIPIQELAAVLVAKGGLKKKDAERFAMTVFDIVKDGLAADRLVKIKGLGTFKLIDIDSRESVNVNTGERVLIEGHEKVTFTPDTAMKDLVNKPFSQFETVVLNEGVDFSEMTPEEEDDDEQMLPQEEPENEVQEPEPVAVPVVVPEPEPEQEPEPEPEQEPEPEPEQEPESEPEPSVGPLKAIADEEPTDEDSCDTVPREQKRAALSPILTAVFCLLCFGLGYYLGGHDVGSLIKWKPTAINDKEMPLADTLKSDTIPSDSVKKDTIAHIINPEEMVEEKAEEIVEEKSEPKPEPKPEVKSEPESEAMPDYGKMDERVRTGAYRIVGTAEVVTVRAGETVFRLSNRYLGPGMECYVEVYNGITAENPLKEGQELKIPKLEVKKKKK